MLKVIQVALNEVGYLEKASMSQLDDKTANAGNANITKYARDLDAIGFFNGRKQRVAWCAVWVCWCTVQAYGVEMAKKLLCLPAKASDNCAAGCRYAMNYFKSKGQFHTSNPQVGDQIFFYSKTKQSISHTGLVYRVDSTKVYTVEGNTSGASGVVANGGGVCQKSYYLDYDSIVGYGRPQYDMANDTQTAEKPTQTPTQAQTTASGVMTMDTLRNGSKGTQVKVLQYLLNMNGYNAGTVDGIFGANTLKAVKAYQKDKGLTVDGIAGKNTWKTILA